MKQTLITLCLIYCSLTYAQKVEFLEKNDTIQKPKYQEFVYISDKTDSSKSIYVAKIKAVGSLKNIASLYLVIKGQAQNIGANSFKIESFKKLDSENGELILSVFYNDDDFFVINFQHLPKNKIYILGSENLLENNTQSYKVQGEKFEIGNGKYKEFEIKIGQQIKINKGGFSGMTLWITGKEERFNTFINFSGIGISGVGYNPNVRGVGINFNTGTINKIETNLALALLKIYSE